MKDLSFEDKLFVGCIARKLKQGIPKENIMVLVMEICDLLEKKE